MLKSSVCIVFHQDYHTSSTQLPSTHHWLLIRTLEYKVASLYSQCLQCESPFLFDAYIYLIAYSFIRIHYHLISNITSHMLRSQDTFLFEKLIFTISASRKGSYDVFEHTIWNSLPMHRKVHKHLKAHLFQKHLADGFSFIAVLCVVSSIQ